MMRAGSKPPGRPQGERMGEDLLQTASAIATVLGFLLSLGALVPFLGTPPQQGSAGPDVLRLLSPEGKVAVLVFSTPIFGLLDTVLVISLARIALSLLRRCGVEISGDLGLWLLLLFVLMPVATGANLAFAIVLFGEVASPLPLAGILANLVVTGYCAFRWLLNAIY